MPELTITRSDALYRLPAGHPQPAAARLRLDRVLADEVPRVLGGLLGDVLAADDPTLWLIRSLDVELTCDLAAVDDRRLGTAWAASLGRSLLTAMKRDAAEGVLRYRNRAAFLAAFLSDLAAGRAWGRWQYTSFDGLRSLPTASALAEALLREPEQIPAVLARLSEDHQLESVLVAMTEGAAARVVIVLLAEAQGQPELGLTRALIARLSARDLAASPARARLRLLAALAGETPALLAAPALASSLGLAELLLALGADSLLFVETLALELGAAQEMLVRRGLGRHATALPALRDLARAQPAALAELVAELTDRASGSHDEQEHWFDSPTAAIFFLLPSYLALGVEELLSELAPRERPALRYQILARALGRDPASRWTADEVMRLVCGLGTAATPWEDTDDDLRVGARRDAPQQCREGRGVNSTATLAPWLGHGQYEAYPGVAQRRRDGSRGVHPPARTSDIGNASDATARADTGVRPYDLAQQVLRHFARRLPGFGEASDAHLIKNFLTGTGRVRVRPGVIDVDLPPIPLAVVARMAGADGLTYDIPWLERTVTVHCAGG